MMINLFLMTEKGYSVLQNIKKEYLSEVNLVVIGRDQNVVKDYSEEIELLCKSLNLSYIFKEKIKIVDFSKGFNIAISWQWLLPHNLNNTIVLHDSLLPKYRGFAPLVNMLINGEKEIGVTALFADKDYDKGDIISQSKIFISYPIKIKDAIKLISQCYCDLINNIFETIHQKEKLSAIPQRDENATYSLWRGVEDYKINWGLDSNQIKRFIDAVGFPYKGASTILNNNFYRIRDCEIVKDVIIENREHHIGKQIFLEDNSPVIVCGIGLLKIKNLFEDNNHNKCILPLKTFRNHFK